MLRFKENVKAYRKANHLTQSAFAVLLNEKFYELGQDITYNNKSISMWEKGERVPDSPMVWVGIAELIGVSVDILMRGDITTCDLPPLDLPRREPRPIKFDFEDGHMYIDESADGESESYEDSESECASDTYMDETESEPEVVEPAPINYAEEYMSEVTNGLSDRESVFNLYANIDSYYEDENMCHGMACFVSKVKGEGGYYSKYHLLDNDNTMDYLSELSKKSFIKEQEFVESVRANGGSNALMTSEQFEELWAGFFDKMDNCAGFNVELLYDSDCDHILAIVEYQLNADEQDVERYICNELSGSNSVDSHNALGKIMLANNKLRVGIRYAKEKWLG